MAGSKTSDIIAGGSPPGESDTRPVEAAPYFDTGWQPLGSAMTRQISHSTQIKGNKSWWKIPSKSTKSRPFPLSEYHITLLSKESELCCTLAKNLNLLEQWETICKVNTDPFARADNFFRYWWSSINNGYRRERKKFLDLLARYGRKDLKDHINETPEHGDIHDSVTSEVVLEEEDIYKIACKLQVGKKEIEGLSDQFTSEVKLQKIIQIWLKNEGSKQSKVHEFAQMCRSAGMLTLAAQVEQGLVEECLREIAGYITEAHVKGICQKLSISVVRWNAFVDKYRSLSETMYQVFCYWSLIQPLAVDKNLMLAVSLETCGLQEVVREKIYKGLPSNDLEFIAGIIGERWHNLAVGLKLNNSDIAMLAKEEHGSKKAFLALQLWKWRISSGTPNLRKALYYKMMDCGLYQTIMKLHDEETHRPYINQRVARKLDFSRRRHVSEGYDGLMTTNEPETVNTLILKENEALRVKLQELSETLSESEDTKAQILNQNESLQAELQKLKETLSESEDIKAQILIQNERLQAELQKFKEMNSNKQVDKFQSRSTTGEVSDDPKHRTDDFNQLLVDVAADLTLDATVKIATLVDMPQAEIDLLQRIAQHATPGLRLLKIMSRRKVINMYDISNLEKALMVCNLETTIHLKIVPYKNSIHPDLVRSSRTARYPSLDAELSSLRIHGTPVDGASGSQ